MDSATQHAINDLSLMVFGRSDMLDNADAVTVMLLVAWSAEIGVERRLTRSEVVMVRAIVELAKTNPAKARELARLVRV